MRIEKNGPGSGKLIKKLNKNSMLTEQPGCEVGVAV
jgi:hypothetical protein